MFKLDMHYIFPFPKFARPSSILQLPCCVGWQEILVNEYRYFFYADFQSKIISFFIS